MRLPALLLTAALALTGCGSATSASTVSEEPVERASMVPDVRKAPAPEADLLRQEPRPTESLPADANVAERRAVRAARLVRGIDVSHHQGSIDWELVAADRVDFAWIKATEGTSFVDPRFAANRDGARSAGLRVGAYHYFSICSDGAPQAEHFVRTVGKLSDTVTDLPPALDVELDPACDPTRDELLAELREFIRIAEKGTGRTVVVYAFPSLEKRYDVAAALERPLWVRRLGDREPAGNWMVWQKSQTATVAGIDGGVDLDLMRH